VLNGNNCACDSNSGFYDDGTSLVCPQCQYSCLTCNGGTSSNCLTCDPISNRYKNNNTCPCSIGFYDANARICVACHYTCQTATCTGTTSTSCSSCNPAKFRSNVTSSFTCPCTTGYYDNGTSSELCSACLYSCLTCTGTNVYCTSCDPTDLRSINIATHTCPCNSAYFDNGVPLCVACDSTCLTCSGALAINCLTCDASVHRTKLVTSCVCANYYYELNKTCTACYYSCLTCTNNTSTGCINCDGNSHRTFNATGGQCLCNAGYVDMGVLVCQACSPSCLTCIYNTTACASCHLNPGRYQAGYSCLCNTGYVDLTFNGVCTPCHYSCASCFSGTSSGCSTCSNNRTLTSNACLCPIGQYDNGYSVICQPCDPSCYTCTNGLTSGCTGCSSVYFRTLNPSPMGTCICQGGYYDVGILLCANCDPKCLTCVTAATTCTSCDLTTNHRVITSNFTCDCTIGYF
jgi:proprotein convertase subtilisin/kexin type 5